MTERVSGFRLEGGFGLERLVPFEAARAPLGPREVRVRVRAVSLNYRDLLVARGTYDPRLPLPHVPGSDASGEVLERGPEARRFALDERVITSFSQGWIAGAPSHAKLRAALGAPLPGVFATELVLDEEGLVRAPSHLSLEAAATLPCAGTTAWHALVDRGGLRAGQTVLVQGSGGVSVFALQIARAMGARVIATSSSAEKRARLEQLGAFATIDYRHTPEWGKAVRALTGGVGVDHVVEVGGAGTLAQSLRAVAVGGTVHVIGVLAGARDTLDVLPVLMNEVTLAGAMVGPRESTEALVRALEAGGVEPVIDRVFPWASLPDALAHLASGAHFGKIVVRAPAA